MDFGSAPLIVLLDVDDDNLTVLAMPLNGCARWQSLSNVLLLVDKHGCSGGCQAVGCGSVVVRISAPSSPKKHLNMPNVALQHWLLVVM